MWRLGLDGVPLDAHVPLGQRVDVLAILFAAVVLTLRVIIKRVKTFTAGRRRIHVFNDAGSTQLP